MKTDLDKYGYCIHLSTGKDLGDMCEQCADDREKQFDYKFWNLVFKLPKGYKFYKWWQIRKTKGENNS